MLWCYGGSLKRRRKNAAKELFFGTYAYECAQCTPVTEITEINLIYNPNPIITK